jgi:protein-S-isoprenylcysteine O-methyltransferase Ste14
MAPRRALPLTSPHSLLARPAGAWWSRPVAVTVNLAGAAGAAFFAVASANFYLRTHSLIGGGFLVEQAWFVLAFLIRRPARAVTKRWSDWLLAFCGTFGGTAFRPAGLHPPWGIWSGLAFQTAGLAVGLAALVTLGRSFGMAPADRGLVTSGPYAVVRHPVYLSYLLVQCGYLLQSLSWRNAIVLVGTAACNIGRALAEERLLAAAESTDSRAAGYHDYRARVRWRLIPGLW